MKKETRRDRAAHLLKTSIQTVEDRQGSYGDPAKDMARIAQIWSAILGIEVPPEKVPLCMIGVKLSRATNEYKSDNAVDIVGYTQVYEETVYAKE